MEILMPRMGLTMETGTVVCWHVKAGEEFAKGQELFDVESDKVTNTIEARFDGVLTEIIVDEGQECNVGAVIAKAEKK
jgi:pyruvate/2-oxoglutarate dehydrogenase complex dihydrolipoamide acyltransferase (E2) component